MVASTYLNWQGHCIDAISCFKTCSDGASLRRILSPLFYCMLRLFLLGPVPSYPAVLQAKVQATWLVLGTSFMVAFTNAAINKITRMMGVFERHLSVDKQEVNVNPIPSCNQAFSLSPA